MTQLILEQERENGGGLAAACGTARAKPLYQREYDKISALVHSVCGINLRHGKMELVQARLNKRLRELGFDCYREYLNHVDSDDTGSEFTMMVDLLTTNLTHFFREERHFDFVRDNLLNDPLFREGKSLRAWSAGCSSGEEAYSLAITLRESLPDVDGMDALVLATDISTRMVAAARHGVYSSAKVENLPPGLTEKYFKRESAGDGEPRYRVKPDLARLIRFRRLNLMASWPMTGAFDVIFCRNVMIYFDKPAQQSLIDRFFEIINPGGYLIVGHSESLTGISHSFDYSLPSVYRKPAGRG